MGNLEKFMQKKKYAEDYFCSEDRRVHKHHRNTLSFSGTLHRLCTISSALLCVFFSIHSSSLFSAILLIQEGVHINGSSSSMLIPNVVIRIPCHGFKSHPTRIPCGSCRYGNDLRTGPCACTLIPCSMITFSGSIARRRAKGIIACTWFERITGKVQGIFKTCFGFPCVRGTRCVMQQLVFVQINFVISLLSDTMPRRRSPSVQHSKTAELYSSRMIVSIFGSLF